MAFLFWAVGAVIFWKIALQMALGFSPNLVACIVGSIGLVPILIAQSWLIGMTLSVTRNLWAGMAVALGGAIVSALWMWLEVQGFDPRFAGDVSLSSYVSTLNPPAIRNLWLFLIVAAVPAAVKGAGTTIVAARVLLGLQWEPVDRE